MKRLYIFLLFISLPFLSKASAYWMEIKGSGKIGEAVTVQLIYGNIDDAGIRHRQTGKELTLAGAFRFNLIDPLGNQLSLKMVLKADCWEAVFTPEKKGSYAILGVNDSHPVVDRSKTGGESVLPVDYLCSRYQIGGESEQLKPESVLDILVSKAAKGVSVRVFKNKEKAKKGTKLRVFNPENWEKELILDENGSAVFTPTLKGMYVIRMDDVEPKAGTYQGVSYTSIRNRCNYCLFVE